jgi:hypothetical protein
VLGYFILIGNFQEVSRREKRKKTKEVVKEEDEAREE